MLLSLICKAFLSSTFFLCRGFSVVLEKTLWCWRRLLRVLWTARRSNQSTLEEINPEFSLEGLMLKLKLQYLGHQMGRQELNVDMYYILWCCPFYSWTHSFPRRFNLVLCALPVKFFSATSNSWGLDPRVQPPTWCCVLESWTGTSDLTWIK